MALEGGHRALPGQVRAPVPRGSSARSGGHTARLPGHRRELVRGSSADAGVRRGSRCRRCTTGPGPPTSAPPTIFCRWRGTPGTGGLAPAGSFQGSRNTLGLYDIAGNAREWCFNAAGENRFVLGAAWSDPRYFFAEPNERPAFDWSPGDRIPVHQGHVSGVHPGGEPTGSGPAGPQGLVEGKTDVG